MYRGVFVVLTIFCGLEAANAASSKKTEESVPMKYSRSIQDVSRYGKAENDVPEKCKNKNFCTIKPADYPQAQFNEMFKGMKNLPPPTLLIEDHGSRQYSPDEKESCETELSYEPVYKVRSASGQWHTVIQAPEVNYIQRARLESCKEENSTCFVTLPDLLSSELKPLCKQIYSDWEFLISDGKNGTEKIKAELPTCCSCVLYNTERKK